MTKANVLRLPKDRGEVLRNLAMHDGPLYELTDEEEAAIQAGIASDPDNPELTDEQLAEMRPLREADPELYAFIQRTKSLSSVIIGPENAEAFGWSPEEIARCEERNGKNWRARVPVEITMRGVEKAPIAAITGEEIRSIRERARMSQAAFANRLNLSTGQVSALERGAKNANGPALVLLDVIRRKGIEAIL